ncbi:MAG: hypothetical protein WAO90_15365 [Mycobacterium sp.]
MIQKLLATCVAAGAIAGGAAAGVTAMASVPPTAAPAVQPVVFGTPMPLNPAVDLPSADQLNSVLYGLADPNVPFASKSYLVEGGLGRLEARTADALMRKAVANGQVPLNFTIADIVPAGPGAATANVTASGPGMPATTQAITFVDQAGWKLSRNSATAVLAILNS